MIETTTKWIEASKEYGREDMAKANEKNLERYQNIYETIKKGNVILGRISFKRRIEKLEKKNKELEEKNKRLRKKDNEKLVKYFKGI